jgi:dihydroneopterin aldolase
MNNEPALATKLNDIITIADLEVYYRIGVTDQERANPQRLLITVEMEKPLAKAAASDDLSDTIDYFAVCQRLLRFGDDCQWRLIEAVAGDIASMLLDEFGPDKVAVMVKKFIIPETRHVAVKVFRARP